MSPLHYFLIPGLANLPLPDLHCQVLPQHLYGRGGFDELRKKPDGSFITLSIDIGKYIEHLTSVIKFAIVKELQQFLIFFHFVPDVQPQGNYSEMFMYNAVKNNEPSFCRHLNVSRTWYSIYEDNEAVLNSSGYSFHAFKIITSNRLTHQVLVMLGNALCETLNGIKQNNNTACVGEENFYWLTQSDCVWAEIVGFNKAQEYLLDKLGNTANTTNVYEQNRELIHSYFCPNILTSKLNNILGGRREILDPTFYMPTQQNPTEEEQHVDEGSHSPIML